MIERSRTVRRIALVAVGLVLSAGAGASIGVLANGSLRPASATDNVGHDAHLPPGLPASGPEAPPPEEFTGTASSLRAFDRNVHGQTIGEYGVGLKGDPAANPDLILVQGEDNVVGYSYTTEVFGLPATDVEQAVRDQQESGAATLAERKVPIYQEDGRTVIGTYIADAGY